MASDVKWIKITTDMFDNRKIKHLRRLPDGNNIVLIWVMLLTMAGRCNANGMVFLTENIPYTPKMLADELDFEENTVTLALKALEQLNMIVTDNEYFSIAGWEEYQNVEGMDKIREQNRIRQKKYYERKKALPNAEPTKPNVISNVSLTQPNAPDKELDKELDNKSKSVKKTTHTLLEKLLPDYALSSSLQAKIKEWIVYKCERREGYKEQGLKTLLRQLANNAAIYGDQAICSLIDDSMANGWKGIIFDRLKQTQRNGYQKPANVGRNGIVIDPSKDDMDDFFV